MKKSKDLKEIFKKENFDIGKIKENSGAFLLQNSSFIFMFFFVIVSVLSLMIIYQYLYSSVWSDAEKEKYLQEISREGIDFREDNFQRVVDKIKERKVKYEEDGPLEVKDIFGSIRGE